MKPKVRLSKFVLPKKYVLQIQPDMEAFTFAGNEVIELALEKNAKEITLHSKELEITDAWWQSGKTRIDVLKTSYNTKAETATFKFIKTLPKGKGRLHIHFRGLIQESLRGFYRSQYEYKGKTMRIATTQFEATDARRAFPCFDEPSHKAVFEVSLVVPKHLTAISNTLEVAGHSATPVSLKHLSGYKVVKFTPTPKMSTYLLAYIIGDFEYIQTKTKAARGKKGVNIRVFTTPGKKKQAKFALDVAKRTLEFLNDYFKVPYPLPGLDLIAIPDFSAAAMENWGAVTFRESALLIDEQNSSFTSKQNVAYVIAHELVHQWFGNLVTMEWWTHLWLNESFATFMGFIAIDNIFPEWHIWTKFVMSDHASALQLDSLVNTHPIEVEVHHPDQIAEIFDAISYEKGGSVLRMLLHYIGAENFRNGLSYYLKKHSYKNTESIHLWQAFEKVSGKPVSKFMAKWVGEPGYPVVTFS
ncbi:MAG TPA: M1 family metallopeptidase, partial [Patescibacteria group bacterium]|nr:M1 family metallopeptidase [Patescibacteria group bacterium]